MLDTAKESLSAIVNADGSVIGTAMRSATALGDMLAKGTQLADQVYKAAQEQESRPRARRLSEKTISAFYDEVEHRLHANITNNKKLQGRRLEVHEVGLTLPEKHIRENGWIAGAADWANVVDEVHFVSKRILQRQDERLKHIQDTGHLPSGPLVDEHKTGYSILDLNAPPSKLGNMFRELHAWITNRHKSTEKRKDHARMMEESRTSPRRKSNDVHESVLGAAAEASVLGNDVVNAMWNTLENSNHHRTSRARRLADTFLGAAATVPLLPTTVSNKYSNYQATDGGVNYFNEVIRYLVYGERFSDHTTQTHIYHTLHHNIAVANNFITRRVCVFAQILLFATCIPQMRRTTAVILVMAQESLHTEQIKCASRRYVIPATLTLHTP